MILQLLKIIVTTVLSPKVTTTILILSVLMMKVFNAFKTSDYWFSLSSLHSYCFVLKPRSRLHRARPRLSFIRFLLTYNPIYLFDKRKEDVEKLIKFADSGEYNEFPLHEIEKQLSKDDALHYCACLYTVLNHRERNLHKKKPHILRGLRKE